MFRDIGEGIIGAVGPELFLGTFSPLLNAYWLAFVAPCPITGNCIHPPAALNSHAASAMAYETQHMEIVLRCHGDLDSLLTRFFLDARRCKHQHSNSRCRSNRSCVTGRLRQLAAAQSVCRGSWCCDGRWCRHSAKVEECEDPAWRCATGRTYWCGCSGHSRGSSARDETGGKKAICLAIAFTESRSQQGLATWATAAERSALTSRRSLLLKHAGAWLRRAIPNSMFEETALCVMLRPLDVAPHALFEVLVEGP